MTTQSSITRAVRRALVAAVVTVVLVGLTAPGVGASVPGRSSALAGEITVSAASSLTQSFERMAAAFRRVHPKATVRVNVGSSSTLATQIVGGAPADVFAAADLASMDRLVAAGAVVATPKVLARNAMAIVVKPGNPSRVRGVADLVRLPVVALCAASAPCGVYARSVLQRAGVTLPEDHVTRSPDATATLGAVTNGDADAAVVYVTDAEAAGAAITVVDVPADQNVSAVYAIAPVATSSRPTVARAFVRFALSRDGQRILGRYGFLAP